MTIVHARPNLIVSRCLGFEHVRYNGGIINSPFVQKLRQHANVETVCPEVALGLGVPRPTIRMVDDGTGVRLFQPETGRDLTNEMEAYALDYCSGVKNVDGFILKAKSPSCGIGGVKVYPMGTKVMPRGKAEGRFGGRVARTFPNAAVEDEESLGAPGQREHFLNKVFMLADFRATMSWQRPDALTCFHNRNRLLLMLYGTRALSRLSRIAAKATTANLAESINSYWNELGAATAKPPRCASCATVLKAAFAPFADKIAGTEKAIFVSTVVAFEEHKLPMSVPVGLLRSYLARFPNQDLESQTLLEPYPLELIEIAESGAQL